MEGLGFTYRIIWNALWPGWIEQKPHKSVHSEYQWEWITNSSSVGGVETHQRKSDSFGVSSFWFIFNPHIQEKSPFFGGAKPLIVFTSCPQSTSAKKKSLHRVQQHVTDCHLFLTYCTVSILISKWATKY